MEIVRDSKSCPGTSWCLKHNAAFYLEHIAFVNLQYRLILGVRNKNDVVFSPYLALARFISIRLGWYMYICTYIYRCICMWHVRWYVTRSSGKTSCLDSSCLSLINMCTQVFRCAAVGQCKAADDVYSQHWLHRACKSNAAARSTIFSTEHA